MLYRKLVEVDIEAYRTLRLRGLKDHPNDFAADHDEEVAWPLARWIERLRTALTFVIEQNGALVACATLRVHEGEKVRHNAWINAMYVAPEVRGGAVGDCLMDGIETEARMLGAQVLKLSLNENNERARRFYTRRGFIAYGHEPMSTIVGGVATTGLEMYKPLA